MSALTPEIALYHYRRGEFFMADSRDDARLFLLAPQKRGVVPLERFHVPRRLAKFIRTAPFDIRIDHAFDRVIEECAAPYGERRDTWINPAIAACYRGLFRLGHAHSVECWLNGELAGGLYGVTLGGVFFGESMFSRARDASKCALVYLAARLIAGGFRLLDAQFLTAHLAQFGAVEIDRAEFRARLAAAVDASADFFAMARDSSPDQVLQSIAQTS